MQWVQVLLMALTLVIVLSLAGLGYALIWSSMRQELPSTPTIFAIALLSGLAVSALSAVWSFGVFSSSGYFAFFGCGSFLGWVVLLARFRNRLASPSLSWRKTVAAAAGSVLVGLIWTAGFQSGGQVDLLASRGPDTSQNIMAAQWLAASPGNWQSKSDTFLNQVKVDDLENGVYRLLTLPSMRAQAGVDYLIFGGRWGLTVPFSEVLATDQTSAFWSQSVLAGFGGIAIFLVVFGLLYLLQLERKLRTLLAILISLSPPLFFQFVNGGLAQIFAWPSLVGISVLLLVLFREPREFGAGNWVLLTISWSALAATYFEAAIAMAFVALLVSSSIGLKVFIRVTLSGSVAIVLILPWVRAVLAVKESRLAGWTGTGYELPRWPTWADALGVGTMQLGGIWSSLPALIFALLLTALAGFPIIRTIRLRNFADVRGSAATYLLGLALTLLAVTGVLGSHYSLFKSLTYLLPFFAVSLVMTTASAIGHKRTAYALGLIVAVSSSTFIGQASQTRQFTAVGIPVNLSSVLTDEHAQVTLRESNFLLPYTVASSMIGIFGDVSWVSKAPNEVAMDGRQDRDLRVLCFIGEEACAPSGKPVSSGLDRYALQIFESGLTTRQFERLDVASRYSAAFMAIGQEPVSVPEDFLGGHPVLRRGS